MINEPLVDPTTFFIPTSTALLLERAVDRFTKLMQAITRTRIPIIRKMRT
jgi:hypothetical protein